MLGSSPLWRGRWAGCGWLLGMGGGEKRRGGGGNKWRRWMSRKGGERGGGWVEKGNFSPRAAKASAAVY